VPDNEPTPAGPVPLGDALARALVDAHGQVAPKIAEANTAHVVNLLETFEQDIGPMVAPIAEQLRNDPQTPEMLHPLLDALVAIPHFGVSAVIYVAIGSILSPVFQAAFAPVVQVIANAAWPKLPNNPLSADLLAGSVLKGVLTESQAAGLAAVTGYDTTAFHTMVQTAGQALGLAEALLLLRRGQITDADFTAVEQYSNLNPKFYGMAALLRYAPLSTGEVVAANLKGHLDDATAAQYLGYTGIDPVHQPLLKAAAGRPIGVEEAVRLWKRGLIDEARLTAIVQQSDVNDAYLPEVKLTGVYYPPPRSIVPMLRAGGITEAEARDLLAKQGVEEPWITAFIAEASKTKTGKVKELTESQVTALYEARLMDRATALARIETLTYTAADAAALLDLADEKRKMSLQTAALRKIGAEYIGRKITLAEATSAMGAAGIPTAAQHDQVTYWDVEKSVNVHRPSPAQVVGAFRRTEISAADCKLRLQQLGVADADIGIFVADGYPPTKAAQAKAEAAAVVNA
jgi:hypothetical protein